jgi:ribonuclease Z
MIEVALLGTGGMMPLPNRWLASAMIRVNGRIALIDCGEGTQIAARMHGFGFKEIDLILITHYHADHVAGLPGMLFMLAQSERTEPVTIAGPSGLDRVVRGLSQVVGTLPYEIELAPLSPEDELVLGGAKVSCEWGEHHARCLAYRVELPRLRRFLPERAKELGVPLDLWRVLQRGEPVEWPGGAASPDEVLGPRRPGLAVAYITDSRPTSGLRNLATRVDLLVCEGTFGDPADAARARERRHMLFSEAAALARDAEAAELWLTHFSPKVDDPARWSKEATRIFPGAVIGKDGMRATLAFRDE